MLRGCTRAMMIWHRRAGKDLTALNWAVFDMTVLHPGGSWWHVWPTKEQGRKFWEGANNEGRRYIDYFPPELIKRKREDMMMLELHNGSIYRVVGSDDPSSLVGANPVGLIMTEYSLQNPAAWDFLRPIVTANGGTAIFPFTPRGHNHAYQLYAQIRNNEKWYVSLETVDTTQAVSSELIQEERDSGMSEELIQQEYYCSFTAPMTGAYFAEEMKRAHKENRITKVPYDPLLPVFTRWDIGLNKQSGMNAIVFTQHIGVETRAIDCEIGSDKSLADWIQIVKAKPYIYEAHHGPHDLAVREYSTNKARVDFAREHGLDFTLSPKLDKADQIDIARRELLNTWFDEEKTFDLTEALKAYSRDWDPKLQVFKQTPKANWAAHPADAWMTGSVADHTTTTQRKERLRKIPKRVYNPFDRSTPYKQGQSGWM